jgi:hypothetical protein
MRLMTGRKDNVVFSFVYYQSRAQYISYESGKEQCSFRTRTGSNIIYRYYVKVKEQGGKEQCFFRTHTGTKKISLCYSKRGVKEQSSFSTRSGD